MRIMQVYVLNVACCTNSQNIFSLIAFHILKDTTIQFTLEKVSIDEDNQFTFQTTEERCKSTGLLKVKGKFVNPVQVQALLAQQ